MFPSEQTNHTRVFIALKTVLFLRSICLTHSNWVSIITHDYGTMEALPNSHKFSYSTGKLLMIFPVVWNYLSKQVSQYLLQHPKNT